MKTIDIKTCLVPAFVVLVAGCSLTDYDNYDPPPSVLTGNVVYQGEPVGVASGEVELELWQDGFELKEKIPVNVRQNGSYTAVLFDGSYKLTLLPGDGPWVVNTDSIDVQLNGSVTVDIPVEPYYIISGESVTHNSGSIDATFDVNEINDSRSVEYVGLYVGTTSIVDDQNNEEENVVAIGAGGSLADQTLSVTLPADLADRDYVFARIGVKTTGVSDMLFSPVNEIAL